MSDHTTAPTIDVWVMNTGDADINRLAATLHAAVPDASVPVRNFQVRFKGGLPLNEVTNTVYVLFRDHKELIIAGCLYIFKKAIDVVADLVKEWAKGVPHKGGHTIVIYGPGGDIAKAVEIKGGNDADITAEWNAKEHHPPEWIKNRLS
jgi:hypothetical protein